MNIDEFNKQLLSMADDILTASKEYGAFLKIADIVEKGDDNSCKEYNSNIVKVTQLVRNKTALLYALREFSTAYSAIYRDGLA